MCSRARAAGGREGTQTTEPVLTSQQPRENGASQDTGPGEQDPVPPTRGARMLVSACQGTSRAGPPLHKAGTRALLLPPQRTGMPPPHSCPRAPLTPGLSLLPGVGGDCWGLSSHILRHRQPRGGRTRDVMGQPVTPNDRERTQMGQRAGEKAGGGGTASVGGRGEAIGTGELSKAVPQGRGGRGVRIRQEGPSNKREARGSGQRPPGEAALQAAAVTMTITRSNSRLRNTSGRARPGAAVRTLHRPS